MNVVNPERPKATLLGCTLNEIEAVQVVLPELRAYPVEVIVCDGGSTDGTVEWCQANGFKVVHQTGGYGRAIRAGVAASSCDIIIEFPPDGNSLASRIPALLDKIESGHDFVIVSRYFEGAQSHDDDFMTAIGNRMFTFMTNALFGTDYTDVLVGYRGYRKSVFETLQWDADGLSWPLQTAVRFSQVPGVRIADIGGDEPDRAGGVRKMRIFKTGWEILMLMFREYSLMRKTQKKALP
jgi:glycosyltransferase involved in cell wall biosynthesis